MSLLRQEIGISMPRNKSYVDEYIDGSWQHVTALTSCFERCEPPAPWLSNKFASYAAAHEQILKQRLEKVRYSINAVETVTLILDHDRIEYFSCVNGGYSTKIDYMSTFYQDKDILAGSFSSRAIGRSDVKGSFFFRKMAAGESDDFKTPNIMCIRPTDINLNSKKLWSFACMAVLDGIRRRKRRYLLERMVKIRRALHLMRRQKLGGLTPTEQSEQSKIYRNFSVDEFADIRRLYAWYERAIDTHMGRQDCDRCGTGISGSRVVCLDCISTDAVPNTVDFCSTYHCIASTTLPGRGDVSHRAWHVMIKTRDFFLLKDYFAVKARAQHAADNARRAYKGTQKLTSPVEPRHPAPRAVTDSTPVVTTLTPVSPFLVLMARQPS
ncbi:hypothetical protein B0H19DRAFT_1380885 [Mycena capillaripes]|nr:hypothetical protein B0H19DRAFT_1380885 [Mycena capillaripes]